MTHPNILLVILDSLRAKNCSLHGYERDTTPFLSDFASDGITFTQARSPSIHSISSHASIFTGKHVEEHNITEHKSFLEPSTTIWSKLSRDYGYKTGLFTANVIVAETSNLADCFDTTHGPKRANFRLFESGLAPLDLEGKTTTKEFIRASLGHNAPVRSILNGVYKKFGSRGGAHDPKSESASIYIEELLDWVDATSQPWAACLNLMDTHTPFLPKEEFDLWGDTDATQVRQLHEDGDAPQPFTDEYWEYLENLVPLYDGTILQADQAIENLVETLDASGDLDETLLVITSDHGEGFGEPSELAEDVRLRHHSWGIDESLTHVPLLVRPPDGDSGQVISEPVSLTQFPNLVESTIAGEDVASNMVDEGDVIASTYRIRPPGDELSLSKDASEPYLGPWRAVYRSSDEGTIKYARRGDESGTFLIKDAQTCIQTAESDSGVIAEVYGALDDAGIRLGSANDRAVADSVEDQLSELGYLR